MALPSQPDRLVLGRPDDWHVHLRDDHLLSVVARYTATQFRRAIIMPNLVPPITTLAAAQAYRDRIRAAVDPSLGFDPLMTCYLTDRADPDEIARGFAKSVFAACKLYPAGATTNADAGVTDIFALFPVFERMQRIGMPLLLHGEVTDPAVDIFDREAVFIERILSKVIVAFPALKMVFEHITTADAVSFVMGAGPNLAATITPHHLRINRNAMFEGGIRPHQYCLPVAKREAHRLALRRAATSGSPKFFLGTDSAPHGVLEKESACGCAGIFNAPFAIESYAMTFEEEGALHRLEGFASQHGPAFYGLPPNRAQIVLERRPIVVPASIVGPTVTLIPFHAGETLPWRLVGSQ